MIAVITACALVLGGAVSYGMVAFAAYQKQQSAPSGVAATHEADAKTGAAGPRIVFRDTAPGEDYGRVASVPLSDPKGTRTVTSLVCDRVYETEKYESCLQTDAGVVTTYTATLFDRASGDVVKKWGLPGLPSRTRISHDDKLVAFTSFVTGSAYATVGFSTATDIYSIADGHDYGNIEQFTLYLDGKVNTAADRNIWGVTFVPGDDDAFFATAATDGNTYLVRGSLSARTLTEVHETAECPSVSPDGTRVAFKVNISKTSTAYWSVAVMDLATGKVTMMPDKRDIDDQVEWLDDSTLLYGLPRAGTPGDYDIWETASDGSGSPSLLIPHAWSPAVITQ
ncbi:hypothetical protein [Gryllotalpicola koreensis]|uniref:PD40 domain-containing protein n=1 Tax=Gryllotalpicola koreensis TaxID=993086 RepID=A0ABP7ZPX0_9MICO